MKQIMDNYLPIKVGSNWKIFDFIPKVYDYNDLFNSNKLMDHIPKYASIEEAKDYTKKYYSSEELSKMGFLEFQNYNDDDEEEYEKIINISFLTDEDIRPHDHVTDPEFIPKGILSLADNIIGSVLKSKIIKSQEKKFTDITNECDDCGNISCGCIDHKLPIEVKTNNDNPFVEVLKEIGDTNCLKIL